ncbi:hypothetical protein ABIB25_005720 [Nakamurella sp. UYEF19]
METYMRTSSGAGPCMWTAPIHGAPEILSLLVHSLILSTHAISRGGVDLLHAQPIGYAASQRNSILG